MKEHEKRGAQRVPYIVEVVCESADNRLTARTSDLSASGVFIHSKLWCEAGSILTLSFFVSSTHIETVGEVCYSIPYIGMGIRFLDLKPEFSAAIERLIESHQADSEAEKATPQKGRIIQSGVEPVDRLLGGLERGNLYLAHGDASGKSLFGIEFLIEGLKQGQPGALVTPHRREDAVRRFTRLGYDCLNDLRRGNLVFFRYAYDIVEQIQQRLHLEPLLRELGPVLDESSPERIVFDPVDSLLAGKNEDAVAPLANQLAVWVRSFGATVVLVTNEENRGIIESLTPSVRESFRFEVRETFDRVTRYMIFETSPSIPDQAVRVDPSRGIFLLEGAESSDGSNEDQSYIDPTGDAQEKEPNYDVQALEPCNESDESSEPTTRLHKPDSISSKVTDQDWEAAVSDARAPGLALVPKPGSHALNIDIGLDPVARASGDRDSAVAPKEARDAFFAMLDELQSFVSSIDPEVAEAANNANAEASVNTRLPGLDTAGFQPQTID